LIGFLFWWFIITKPMQGGDGEAQLAAVDTAEVAGETPASGGPVARGMDEAESASAQPEQSDSTVAEEPQEGAATGEDRISQTDQMVEEKAEEIATPAEDPGEQRIPVRGESATRDVSPDDVYVAADFTEFAGKYLVHISSFRGIERAKEDAAYLLRNNFAGCVIPVDLDSKGRWYRVYAGPLDTRDEALQQKIMLDELPRVQFTRITRAPGF
jgi:cell division septation protein DedD